VVQDGLFDLKGQALAEARTAVRRARERALTAVPRPSLPPGPRKVSPRARTIVGVPRGPLAQPAPAHGTPARYNHKTDPCRCPRCTQANTRYIRSYRHRNDGPILPLAGHDVADVKIRSQML
jgi:hypothetical protein